VEFQASSPIAGLAILRVNYNTTILEESWYIIGSRKTDVFILANMYVV
jgi:hypothetical protein